MRIHYLQHVSFEGPGYIRSWVNKKGYNLNGTHFFESQPLPGLRDFDALVVMGGPMGVGDEQKYPWLRKEKKFIKECISQKKKVLGICLGAQLIANVLGAKVEPMPGKEIGWFPVKWDQNAREHRMFNFLPERQLVLHWHGDEFKIPRHALPLAHSEACENQGFLFNNHVLGLQFHTEMTKEGLAALIENSGDELAKTGGQFIQNADNMLTENTFTDNHQTMEQLLDRFLAG